MDGADMQVFLTTDRMALRRITPDDAPLLLGLDSDPEVMRFLTGGRPSTPEEIDRNIRRYQEWYRSSPDRGYWIAQDTDGAFLGWFHLRHPRGGAPAEPELGYRLARAHWGRGLATEGSRALLSAAFADPSVRRVFARTMAVNTGSRRVMEKVGMRPVRTFALDAPPIPGSEHGEVEYALTREDRDRVEAERPRRSAPEA
ncbi:GNAT family N-acetyltransferase [Nocardiopsis suaedae]|uniref:GNAT family N-acetyltransferase n=1 Tax=Nocardiopsis suaedae TaxID=3018444 RepID=A0ABT4TGU3_9ACTN|nr:GNAT family N-acetyltransferase [Nocardiopsis suaedae]MDA2803876.1 GNAT family N-acetyltransferase [Nocardiopsis suaedae]